MHPAERFAPFSDTALFAVTRSVTNQLKEFVDREEPSIILNGDPAAYAEGLATRFAIPLLDIKVDQATSSMREQPSHEPAFNIYTGRQAGDPFTQKIVTVRVPFSGNRAAFRYFANARTACSRLIWLSGSDVCFDVFVPERPSADVKPEVDQMLSCLSKNTKSINQEISQFNRSLPELARNSINQRRDELKRDQSVLEKLGLPVKQPPFATPLLPASGRITVKHDDTDASHETHSRESVVPKARALRKVDKYDLFLSHAGEDKDAIARPLFNALTAAGVTVWFDEAVLKLGDSLRRKIEEGLAKCRYGIVIISPAFFAKEWPQRELDGLAAAEIQSGKRKILPIWHEIDDDAIVQRSPMLADRVASKSSEGIDALVKKILEAIG